MQLHKQFYTNKELGAPQANSIRDEEKVLCRGRFAPKKYLKYSINKIPFGTLNLKYVIDLSFLFAHTFILNQKLLGNNSQEKSGNIFRIRTAPCSGSCLFGGVKNVSFCCYLDAIFLYTYSFFYLLTPFVELDCYFQKMTLF